jgi:hypothetical protein
MRERTFTFDREDEGGVALLDPPRRQTGRQSNGKRADEFAAAARQAIEKALSADSETFLQATRQTSGQ